MKNGLYKWHVYSALFVSIFFTFLLITGIANVFHGKIKQWENPQFFSEIKDEGALLSPEELYRKFSLKYPEYSISLLRKIPGKEKKPLECMLLSDQKEVYGYIHPISAELIGINEYPIHKKILKWHTSLTLGRGGHFFMGFVGIIIAICIITGIAYFLKTARRRRNSTRTKKWHFALGILTLIFNLLMVFTGIFLQYQDVMKKEKPKVYDYPEVLIHLDSALAAAKDQFPEVSFKRIKFPAGTSDPVVLIGDEPGKWYLGSMPFELKLDRNTAETISVKEETSIKGEAWIQKTLITLHAGQYGGGVSRWVYLAFSLGTLGSIITGLLNYRQLRKRAYRKD